MKLYQTKICEEDLKEINEIMLAGQLGFGENVSLFEEQFAEYSNKEYNVATNSASAAAFMIYAFLKDCYGVCDVYTTSLGFTSPAWAVKHFGHNLYFVDVDEHLMFSTKDYKERRIKSSLPKVVMPVLYGGVSDIQNFDLVGDEIIVIDSAHCVTPTIQADFLFYSFHPYKPICTSDGGIISTDDRTASEYFKNYRNFGRENSNYSYDIAQDGFKFYMNNLNATIGLTQLKKYNENLKARKKNYNILLNYFDLLPQDLNSSYYFATILTDYADDIIEKNELSRHYPMLHKTDYYKSDQVLPYLEKIHSKILNLPIHQNLRIEDLNKIVRFVSEK